MRQRERRQRGEIDRRGCGWRAGHARFAPFLYGGIGCAVRRGFRIRRDHHRRGIDWRRHTGDQRAGAGCELGEHVTKDRVPAVEVRRGRPLLDLVGAAVLDEGAQLDAALPFAACRVIDGRAARRADALTGVRRIFDTKLRQFVGQKLLGGHTAGDAPQHANAHPRLVAGGVLLRREEDFRRVLVREDEPRFGRQDREGGGVEQP